MILWVCEDWVYRQPLKIQTPYRSFLFKFFFMQSPSPVLNKTLFQISANSIEYLVFYGHLYIFCTSTDLQRKWHYIVVKSKICFCLTFHVKNRICGQVIEFQLTAYQLRLRGKILDYFKIMVLEGMVAKTIWHKT